MGNYATYADVVARFESDVELAHLTDTGDSGVPDQAVVNECIEYSEGIEDSYFHRRYATPLDVSVDAGLAAMLKSVTLDLTVYNLLVRGDVMPRAKKEARDGVMEWLGKVSSGEVDLPSAVALDTGVARGPIVSYGTAGTGSTSNRQFTRAMQENL